MSANDANPEEVKDYTFGSDQSANTDTSFDASDEPIPDKGVDYGTYAEDTAAPAPTENSINKMHFSSEDIKRDEQGNPFTMKDSEVRREQKDAKRQKKNLLRNLRKDKGDKIVDTSAGSQKLESASSVKRRLFFSQNKKQFTLWSIIIAIIAIVAIAACIIVGIIISENNKREEHDRMKQEAEEYVAIFKNLEYDETPQNLYDEIQEKIDNTPYDDVKAIYYYKRGCYMYPFDGFVDSSIDDIKKAEPYYSEDDIKESLGLIYCSSGRDECSEYRSEDDTDEADDGGMDGEG